MLIPFSKFLNGSSDKILFLIWFKILFRIQSLPICLGVSQIFLPAFCPRYTEEHLIINGHQHMVVLLLQKSPPHTPLFPNFDLLLLSKTHCSFSASFRLTQLVSSLSIRILDLVTLQGFPILKGVRGLPQVLLMHQSNWWTLLHEGRVLQSFSYYFKIWF